MADAEPSQVLFLVLWQPETRSGNKVVNLPWKYKCKHFGCHFFLSWDRGCVACTNHWTGL